MRDLLKDRPKHKRAVLPTFRTVGRSSSCAGTGNLRIPASPGSSDATPPSWAFQSNHKRSRECNSAFSVFFSSLSPAPAASPGIPALVATPDARPATFRNWEGACKEAVTIVTSCQHEHVRSLEDCCLLVSQARDP